MSGGTYLARRVVAGHRWRKARSLRSRLRSTSPVNLVLTGRFTAAGLGSTTDLYRAGDVFGRSWGFLHVASTGHGSIVLTCEISGDALEDAERAGTWVARLGLWLAMLSHEPDLVACVVSIDRGSGTSDVEVRLQLTYQVAGPHDLRDPAAQATELAARIPELTRSLADVGRVTAATSESVRATVLAAYSPSSGSGNGTPAPARVGRGRRAVQVLDLKESWNHVGHGSERAAVSTTWSLSRLASSVVLSSALPPLMTIPPDLAHIRVGLMAQPSSGAPSTYDPREWTGLSAGALGLRTPKGTEEDLPTPAFSMLVTATVARQELLADAALAVRGCLPPDVQPWLRPLYGDQAAGFAAGLPLGLAPDEHTLPPRTVATAPEPRPGRT